MRPGHETLRMARAAASWSISKPAARTAAMAAAALAYWWRPGRIGEGRSMRPSSS